MAERDFDEFLERDQDRVLFVLPPKVVKPTSGRTMSLNMLVYRVTEKKDLANPGETGDPFEAFNVSAVKRIATRR